LIFISVEGDVDLFFLLLFSKAGVFQGAAFTVLSASEIL
jgi:hypothetical protein